MVLITLKLIVFSKFSEFSNFKVSVLFCLIVTKLIHELAEKHFFSGELRVVLLIFSFV